MQCEACLSLIEDYLDAELKQPEAEAVQNHLRDCVTCAALAQKFEAEQKVYASYAPDLKSDHLWAGIHARLNNEAAPPPEATSQPFWSKIKAVFAVPRISGWATAALVLLAIASTAIFMKYTQSQKVSPAPSLIAENKQIEKSVVAVSSNPASVNQPVAPPKAGDRGSVAIVGERAAHQLKDKRAPATARNTAQDDFQQTTATKTPTQLVREAELKYLAAITMLSRNAERRRSQIDSATLAKLDQAIASIDRTIAGTRKAARQHPDDPVAVQYMLTAYAKKVDVLREMSSR